MNAPGSAATRFEEQNAMTGMRTWRKTAKSLIIVSIAWDVAAAIAGVVLLILVMVQGGAPSPDSLISVVGELGLLGLVVWAICDARRWRRRRPVEGGATADEFTRQRPM
jgi:hypothetical protein